MKMEETNEEKGNEESEETEVEPGEGNKYETTSLIADADAAAERLEKANERKAELLAREENLEARKKLSGESEAGQKKPEPKPEPTPEEFADSYLEGKIPNIFK